MATNYAFLYPGENILMEGSANMQQALGINKGGKLILTNRRLVFVAHAFNVGSKFDEIPLSAIAVSGNSFNLFVPTPNMIKVVTTSGEQYQFVVTKKQRDEWVENICRAAIELRSKSSPGYGVGNNAQYSSNAYAGYNSAPPSIPSSGYGANDNRYNANAYSAYGSAPQPIQQKKKKSGWRTLLYVVAIVGAVIVLFDIISTQGEDVSGQEPSYVQEDHSSEQTTTTTTTTTAPTTTTTAPKPSAFANEYIMPCDNYTGAIFSFTLDEFTQMYNQNVYAFLSRTNATDEYVSECLLDETTWEYVSQEDESGYVLYSNMSVYGAHFPIGVMCEPDTNRVYTVMVKMKTKELSEEDKFSAFEAISSSIAATLYNVGEGESDNYDAAHKLFFTIIDKFWNESIPVHYKNIYIDVSLVDPVFSMAFTPASDAFIKSIEESSFYFDIDAESKTDSSPAEDDVAIRNDILALLSRKQFQPPLAPSIIDVLTASFVSWEISIEHESENRYYITFDGTVKINVVTFPGSVTYLVDLDNGSCGTPQYTGQCQTAMTAALSEMLY